MEALLHDGRLVPRVVGKGQTGLHLLDWLGGSVVINTQWRDVTAVVAVDVRGGSVVRRLSPADGASWTLLDCKDGGVPASQWAPLQGASSSLVSRQQVQLQHLHWCT